MTRRLLAVAVLAAAATPATARACQPDSYCPPRPVTCRYAITQQLCPAPVY